MLQENDDRNREKRRGTFRLFTNGHTLYDSLFTDIRQAKKYIYIHFYIIGKDRVSKEFLSLLQMKCKEGVEVKLSADWFGSHKLTGKMQRELQQSGVQFTFSRKPKWKSMLRSLQARNHRRIVVIDGHISYIGGFNIGTEYIGEDPKLGTWRDYHIRIDGDGAQDMEERFLQDWRRDTGEEAPCHVMELSRGPVEYEYVFTEGSGFHGLHRHIIEKASSAILIAMPYFVPETEMMDVLLGAMRRGVSVTVLLPYKSDAFLLKQAAYPYVRQLIRHGANVLQYKDGFFHGKVIVADGETIQLGTSNFDRRSLYVNDESDCFIYSGVIMNDIQTELQNDIAQCRQLTMQYFQTLSWKERMMERLAGLIWRYL